MSSTLKAERNAVRFRLNDLNIGNAILQADLVDAAVQDVYLAMVAEGLGARAWSQTVTLSASINEYFIPTDSAPVEQADLIAFRFFPDAVSVAGGFAGQMLDRIDPVELKRLDMDPSALGISTCCALQDEGGVTTLWLYPIPNGALDGARIELFASTIPTNLVLDTDIVYLSRSGLAALREIAASRIAASLGPKMLEKLDLSPTAWQDMKANGDRMLYAEKARIHRQWQPTANKRPGYPVTA